MLYSTQSQMTKPKFLTQAIEPYSLGHHLCDSLSHPKGMNPSSFQNLEIRKWISHESGIHFWKHRLATLWYLRGTFYWLGIYRNFIVKQCNLFYPYLFFGKLQLPRRREGPWMSWTCQDVSTNWATRLLAYTMLLGFQSSSIAIGSFDQ